MSGRMLAIGAALVAAACAPERVEAPAVAGEAGSGHLFVWAGDKDKKDSDFLAVIDVKASSPTYGEVVATLPIGATGTMPHHTEYEFPEGGMLFADGWLGSLTSLIDLRDPRQPKLATQFKAIGEYAYPHSYVRTDGGNALVTVQGMNGVYGAPGGLAELAPDGEVLRTVSAKTAETAEKLTWPYSLAVVPGKDRAVVALAEMGMPGKPYVTNNQVQVWSVSDLKVVATVDLPAVDGGYNIDPAEPRAMADGSVYVGTFTCGVWRIEDVTEAAPKPTLVHTFPGGTEAHNACAVPVVVGKYYVQTVPEINGLIALDVSDPAKPVEASRIVFHPRFSMPHWVAADRKSNRLVATGNDLSWALVVKLDTETGVMTVDEALPGGVNFDRRSWPHGETGAAVVHGALFGQ